MDKYSPKLQPSVAATAGKLVRRSSQTREILENCLGLVAVLILLIAVFSFATKHFFSFTTFTTIANQIPTAVLIAVGMTLVLIIAGIDLSVGSVLAVSGGVLGIALVHWHLPLFIAVLLSLLVGAFCGFINGAITVRFQLPSFIVTLGVLEAARGAAYLVTNSQTQYIGAQIEQVNDITIFGLSFPFFVAIVAVVVGQLLLTGTVFGRYLIALGTNEEAVRLSGIDPRPIKIAVFTLSGALSGLASVAYCSRLASVDPNAGSGFELEAIAAVVIGGTSLMGGRGSVVNSLFGVLVISVLENGLAQLGAQEPVKRLMTGAVIVAAVIVDFYRSRRADRKAQAGN
jgi:ribose transport system permease protein